MQLHRLHILLVCLLAMLGATRHASAQGITFVDGANYRIQCDGKGSGGVTAGAAVGDPSVLLYLTTTDTPDVLLWTITTDGTDASGHTAYTLRHTATGLYATYDGQRNDYKRYVELTAEPQGDASRWTFTDRGGSWSIDNVLAPEHHWHVRSSLLTGTYADDVTPGTNSRFSLYTPEGLRVDQLTPPEPSFGNLIGTFRVGNKTPVYDADTQTYLITLPEHYRADENITLPVHFDATAGTLTISGHAATAGEDYTFLRFKNGHNFQLRLTTPEGNTYKATLAFTFLPVIELFGYGFSPNYAPGMVRVNDPDTDGDDPLLHMKTHWRGNTSLHRAKKCYALKLTDADGQSEDHKLLGLRSDNNWVLDAAMIDPSRVRNRVSTDIWNDFRTDPYYADAEPKARTATRGRMVELFLNGSYDGIYCMTEKLDRKQLKLRKLENPSADSGQESAEQPQQHGIIYKAVEWHYTSYFGYEGGAFTGVLPAEPLNTSDAWGGWEIKYPDLGDGEPIDWGPLYDHVSFVATADAATFAREAAARFDLPVLRDYYLLQELAMGFDNSAKNIYWFIYDAAQSTRMSLAPWDFDGTWGRIWNGTVGNSDPSCTLRDFSGNLLSANKIYSLLMRYDIDKWNEDLAARYCQLRYAGHFSPERLKERFTDYFDLLAVSGATQREVQRWDGIEGFHIDFDTELPYIHQWIDTHIAVLDAFYHYDPLVVGGQSPIAAAAPIDVYTLDGRRVVRISASTATEAEQQLRALPSGIYVVGGRKVRI